MQEMPKPSENHRKLHRFAGNWVGEEKLSPSPWGPGGPAMGRLTGKIDLDGFFVVSDYIEEKDGKTVFKGHNVFGWDGQSNDVVWYWFDSMGFPPAGPSHGNWDGDTLVLRNSSPQGEGRYTFRFEGKDRYYFSIENSRDGGKSWQKFMEGNYKRV
jgi:hypothetical protein